MIHFDLNRNERQTLVDAIRYINRMFPRDQGVAARSKRADWLKAQQEARISFEPVEMQDNMDCLAYFIAAAAKLSPAREDAYELLQKMVRGSNSPALAIDANIEQAADFLREIGVLK